MEEDEGWGSGESRKGDKKWSPWRIVGLMLLLVAVGLGIAGGLFWQRVRQGQQRLKRELETVVNLEAQSLLGSDRETYLALQDEDDSSWYRAQGERFDTISDMGARLEPGQLAELAVTRADWLPVENRAWAEVAWAEEDGLYRRVQFYRRQDGQWLRSGPREAYFGQRQTLETAHFAFKYPAREEETVHWLAEQFETWYEAICADLGCEAGGQPVNVLIAPDGGAGSDYRPPRGFSLQSPLTRGVREDGALLVEDRARAARVLVYTLVTRHAEGDIEPEEQPYLVPQLVNWELRRLGLAEPNTPSTPVLDAVMASRGLEGIRALWAAMAQTNSESLALRRALDADLTDLGVELGQYLTALLALERQMMEWQTDELAWLTADSLARRVFFALLAVDQGQWRTDKVQAFRNWRDVRDANFSYRPLAHAEVARWEMIPDSAVWAEVSYRDRDWNSRGELSFWRVEFFALQEGAWRHTAPFSRPLGDKVYLTSDHFRILCFEREVDFMRRELGLLEGLYQQIAAALESELPPGERVLIETTDSRWGSTLLTDADAYASSPYLLYWSGEPGASYLAEYVSRALIEKLAIGPDLSDVLAGPRGLWWTATLGVWQHSFTQVSPIDWSMLLEIEPLTMAVRSNELLSLVELEVMFENEMGYWLPEGWTETTAELAYLEAVTIVGYIGETYDSQAYVTLLQTLPQAESLENWLETALEVDVETFEAEWKAWLLEQIDR